MMNEGKTGEELNSFLKEKVPLFEGFAPAVIEEIAGSSEQRTFEGNEAIIECGEDCLLYTSDAADE